MKRIKIFIITTIILPIIIGLASCDKEIDQNIIRQANNESYFSSFADSVGYKKVFAPGTYGDNYVYIKYVTEETKDLPKPIYTSSVKIRYKTYLLQSWLKDSKTARPISNNYNQEVLSSTPINNLIIGAKIAIQNMKVGEHIYVAIPWYLGYGNRDDRVIPSYSALLMDIELVDIVED